MYGTLFSLAGLAIEHEVLVPDPNYAPMYANRSRRTTTDRRDARTLMDAAEDHDGPQRPANVSPCAAHSRCSD